jgi:hypothetical protein
MGRGGLVKKSWAKVRFYINDIVARGRRGKDHHHHHHHHYHYYYTIRGCQPRIIISLLHGCCTVSTREEHRRRGGERFPRRTVYIIDYRTNRGVDESHHNLIISIYSVRSIESFRRSHTTDGQKIIIIMSIIFKTRRIAVCVLHSRYTNPIHETQKTPSFSVPTIFR